MTSLRETADAVRSDALGFDPERLRAYLLEHVSGADGPMTVDRVRGGQSNPTFFVDFPARRLVFRKRPDGPTLPSAHAIDREFRVLDALKGTGLPVPAPLLFNDDLTLVGTPFYVMERLDGRIFDDAALPGIAPADRAAYFFAAADALAQLHAIDPAAVGLADYGRPGDYFQRQIARWSRQWRESPTNDIPALDSLVRWLPDHQPPDDGRIAIAHGDYRFGNLIFHPVEPRIVGILDWELSTLGHPLADLGFCCMPWHTAPQEYAGILGLDHEALGIPTQDAFVAHYMARAVPTGPLLPFHIVFALFRFAVIFVGIADRVRAGTAAGENAASVSPLARHFARRALDVAEAS